MASQNSRSVSSGMGKTIGETGTILFHGQLSHEEYNRRLATTAQRIRIYEMMRRSEEAIHAGLCAVKYPLLGLEREIQPASQEAEDKLIAGFVKRELFNRNLNFNKFSREAMTFFDFGHSVAEKTYELTEFEGKTLIGLKEAGFRKQTSIFAWETRDNKPGITQMLTAPQQGESLRSIIRPKLIVWTNDQEGDNYEGISLLRYAFKSWDMADKLGLIHAIGLEKMAIPTPIIKKPQSPSPTDEAKAAETIQQYRSNEKSYMMLPFGWEVDKLDMSGQTLSEMLPALEHYEKKMLLSVMAQFLMLGMSSNGSGSRATSEDHSELFLLSEEAANNTFQDQIQEDIIKQICDLNFTNLKNGYPRLISTPIRKDKLSDLADVMQKLKGAGVMTPTFETEQHLRKIGHLPELPDDYQKDYDTRRTFALENPGGADTTGDGMKNTPKPDPKKDPSLEKETKKKAAIEAAKHSNGILADLILEP
jgi:hypothetical protein